MENSEKAKLCSACGSQNKSEPLFPLSPEGKPFCGKCFAAAIEKRMRAAARQQGVSKWKEAEYLDDKSAAAAATAFVLARLFKGSGRKIVRVEYGSQKLIKGLNGRKGAKAKSPDLKKLDCLLPLSIEEAAAEGISFFFGAKNEISLPVSISSVATMKELDTFCTLKKIEFTSRETVKNSFLEAVAGKNPHSYTGVISSILKLSGFKTPGKTQIKTEVKTGKWTKNKKS